MLWFRITKPQHVAPLRDVGKGKPGLGGWGGQHPARTTKTPFSKYHHHNSFRSAPPRTHASSHLRLFASSPLRLFASSHLRIFASSHLRIKKRTRQYSCQALFYIQFYRRLTSNRQAVYGYMALNVVSVDPSSYPMCTDLDPGATGIAETR
jgi:hypothetical protein